MNESTHKRSLRARIVSPRSLVIVFAFFAAFVVGTGVAAASSPYFAVGVLHWDGNWTNNNFTCDGGYGREFYYNGLDQGDTNSGSWYACHTNDYPSDALQWSGNKSDGVGGFTCSPGYYLKGYHYEAGSSNNANWYACIQ